MPGQLAAPKCPSVFNTSYMNKPHLVKSGSISFFGNKSLNASIVFVKEGISQIKQILRK